MKAPNRRQEGEPRSAPRIVAFGGGTGISCLVSGLKRISPNITAIVTVTDNGGSSGRLRKEFDMVPPGDIRNCLLALAEGEPLLSRLLEYRFEESELAGHSFGNLFITALTRVTGSFDVAVRELNRMLHVRGKVLPATGHKISLIAHHADGSKSTGEVQIARSRKPIERVEIRPRVHAIEPDVAAAIRAAELMVFGPGSLFTSVIPNLLVEGIRREILANPCAKVYVANIMTQPGETTDLDLAGHLRALEIHAGASFLSGVVVHRGAIPPELLGRYAAEGAYPVAGFERVAEAAGIEIVSADLLDRAAASIRHAPEALARIIAEHFESRNGNGGSAA
ncbi:MAG: uridine diphosphate-N-acetylglucosamine-binding protein YvcK [Planctomycetes bacterium]|nr:uridine diphosphate-N-acetylglucosamine-binding protein YvcK [Planctomycetota bacterium]